MYNEYYFQVIFQLSDSLAKATAEKFPAPNEHKLILSKVEQSQAVFSESIKTGSNEKSDEKEEEEDTNNDICLEGVVMQRADCKPIQTPQYMDLKKQSILSSRAPSRRAQQLNSAIFPIYKPVSKHKADEEHEKKQKLEGKRARAEKADVLDMLFKAFERHQYYYMKDLIKITQQPSEHLKEILRSICIYNTKNPHKSMWELKAEYRHYDKKDSA